MPYKPLFYSKCSKALSKFNITLLKRAMCLAMCLAKCLATCLSTCLATCLFTCLNTCRAMPKRHLQLLLKKKNGDPYAKKRSGNRHRITKKLKKKNQITLFGPSELTPIGFELTNPRFEVFKTNALTHSAKVVKLSNNVWLQYLSYPNFLNVNIWFA